jgi:hypothetical protein
MDLIQLGFGDNSLYGLSNMRLTLFKKPIEGRSKTVLKAKPSNANRSVFGTRQDNEMYYNTLFI